MLFRNDKDKNDRKDGRDVQGETVPLLPLRELIVFPHQVYPIFVGRQPGSRGLAGVLTFRADEWRELHRDGRLTLIEDGD